MKKSVYTILILALGFMFIPLVKADENPHFYPNGLPASTGVIYQTTWSCENKNYTTEESCYSNGAIGHALTYDSLSFNRDIGLVCSSYYLNPPATALYVSSGATCVRNDDWSPALRYAIATVIGIYHTKEYDDIYLGTRNHVYLSIAINNLIASHGSGGASYDNLGIPLGKSTPLRFANDSIYTQYVDVGETAFKDYMKGDAFKMSALNLTYNSSTDTYTGTITISDYKKDITEFSKPIINVEGATATLSNDKINVSIPGSRIKTKTNVTVNLTAKRVYPQARNYTCTASTNQVDYRDGKTKGYQTMTPVAWEKIENNETKGTSTTIGPEKVTVTIKKVDNKGNLLEGATLNVKATDGSLNKNITASSMNLIFDYGKTYKLTEVKAPDGYVKSTKEKTITVDSNGNIKVDGKSSGTTITFENEKIQTIISKAMIVGGPEISGAKLKISNGSGPLACSYLTEDGREDRMVKCEWESGSKPMTILGLKPGNYTLTELIQPEGYELSSKKVNFTVKDDGSVTKVTMINEYTKLTITKVNPIDGRALKGAKLKLLDKDKKEMNCFVMNSKGNPEALKKCEWTSGEDSKVILGLKPNTTYYLQELEAPKGYILNDKLLEIKIDDKGSSKEVKVVNDLEVEVPSTLSARSTLLLAIAMFDIALGLGILTYVRKNKLT